MPRSEPMDGLAFDCPHCNMRHTGLPAIAFAEPAAGFDDAGQQRPFQKFKNDL